MGDTERKFLTTPPHLISFLHSFSHILTAVSMFFLHRFVKVMWVYCALWVPSINY